MRDSATPLSHLLSQAMSRRRVLRGGASLLAMGLLAACQPSRPTIPAEKLKHKPTFPWAEVPHGLSENPLVPADWRMERLSASLPVTTGLYTVPGATPSQDHCLLWLSHGMGLSPKDRASDAWAKATRTADNDARAALQEMVSKAQAETGGSLLALAKQDGIWRTVTEHPLSRRIDMATVMQLSGPAAGHGRLKTESDPSGKRVLGMLSPCTPTRTPWGTILVGEGDIHRHFRFPTDAAEAARLPEGENHVRMNLHDDGWHRWGELDARFDARRTPNEANRFGWVVEIDPYNPKSTPIKRTALGRFAHTDISCASTPDGRAVIYLSDGQQGEYLYRFVSDKAYVKGSPAPADILDQGTLSVARFDELGMLRWLPLTHGNGPLISAQHFDSQADVLIETRRAADLLTPTKLDLPSGVTIVNGRVYLAIIGNPNRAEADAVQTRTPNPYGQMVELVPPTRGGAYDHGATVYDWNLFMQGGDPSAMAADQPFYLARASAEGWLTNPSQLTADNNGHLWLATDGIRQNKKLAEKLFAVPVKGPWRGRPYAFFRAPSDSGIAGPVFTPDDTVILLSLPEKQEIIALSSVDEAKIPSPV